MDDIVLKAIAKWPNVPHCYGWLGLDARGQWWMRDDRAQALGGFASGVAGAKGSLLRHDKLIDFIHRNYEADEPGRWYFQNGPQRVYVELQATPLVWRVQADFSIVAHTGLRGRAQRCVVDEQGRVYMEADSGFGLIHTQDVLQAANAIEQGLWVPEQVLTRDLPARFGYVRSPQALHATAQVAS
jgi:Protein of unknown function (DUF2946)